MKMSDHITESDFSANSSFSKVFYEEPCHMQDTLNLARSLFDLREYRKCAHVLQPLTQNIGILQENCNKALV